MNRITKWFRGYRIKKAISDLVKSTKRLEIARKKRMEIQNGKTPWWY